MDLQMPGKIKGNGSDSLNAEEALRVTRAQLWRLSANQLTIQENERRRIAAELHDGLGQILSILKRSLDESAQKARSRSKSRETLQHLSAQVKYALGELHRVAMNLRPAILDDLGIVAALRWYFREFEAASPQIEIERNVTVTEADVPDALKTAIFRIVQEATANALKHAEATVIRVALTSAGGVITLAVGDNGRGFDVEREAHHHDDPNCGLGLQTMRERAELSGGTYEFESASGQGTQINVTWRPLEASDEWCPVIPISRPLAQSMCASQLSVGQLSDGLSICLTCVRKLCAAKEEGAASRLT